MPGTKLVTYYKQDGRKLRIGENRVALARRYYLEGEDLDTICEDLNITIPSAKTAMRQKSFKELKTDMLHSAQDRGYTRAHAVMNELLDDNDPKIRFASSKFRIEERDGKAQTRIKHEGEVTHTHRLVVDVTDERAPVEADEPVTLEQGRAGVYALPEGDEDD